MNSFFKTLGQDIKINSKSLFYNKNVRTNTKNTIFTIIFIIVAVLLSFIIISGVSSKNMGLIFEKLFNPRNFSYGRFDAGKNVISYMSMLGVAGLSFMFAYKSGIFNIGISGQMLAAILAILGLSEHLKSINSPILNSDGAILLSLVVAFLTGALVALVSGVLKNLFNINEVVSAIMLNWIIFYIMKYLTLADGAPFAGVSGESKQIHDSLALYDPNFNSGFIGAISIFIVFAVVMFVVFKFTSYGRKIIAIGKSQSAGVYAGYSTKMYQLSSFIISGGIAGILALIVYTTTKSGNTISSTMSSLPIEGFDGIAIAMVSFSNPIVIIPISYFFGLVKLLDFNTITGASNMTISLVMYGIAIFVIIYRVKPIVFFKNIFRKKDSFNAQSESDKIAEKSFFGWMYKLTHSLNKNKSSNTENKNVNTKKIMRSAKFKYFVYESHDDYLDYVNEISKLFAKRKISLYLMKNEIINNVYGDSPKNIKNYFAFKKQIFNKVNSESQIINDEIIKSLNEQKKQYISIKQKHIQENYNSLVQGAN